MSDEFANLPPDIQAQISDAGMQLDAQGVEQAPIQEDTGQEAPAIENIPDDTQAQIADAGQQLADPNDEVATVAPESGPPTDWNQQPGGEVPEPAYVEQEAPAPAPEAPQQEQ